jgi:putative effector of murein hydrolase
MVVSPAVSVGVGVVVGVGVAVGVTLGLALVEGVGVGDAVMTASVTTRMEVKVASALPAVPSDRATAVMSHDVDPSAASAGTSRTTQNTFDCLGSKRPVST